MQKFIIAIEKTVVQEFEVVAEDTIEALNIAEQKYREDEFVLKQGKVQFRQMASVGDESPEWVEF